MSIELREAACLRFAAKILASRSQEENAELLIKLRAKYPNYPQVEPEHELLFLFTERVKEVLETL